MPTSLTRREFVKGAAYAATTLSVGGLLAAEETKPLTVALVGGAHIHTPSFLELLKGRRDVRVKSVWDHDAARAAKRAGVVGAKVVGDVHEIWADSEVTAVVICSETTRHHDLVLEAAKAKKHIFAEKPLGINSRESYEMAAAIDRAGLLFTTGYFMRSDPKHLFLKEQVALGNLGKITRIRGSNCHSGSLGGWFDTEWRWMADPKISGVGAFGDLGTHSLDILMWLMGDVESVAADIKIVTGRYAGCDECGEALIKFKSGVTGTLAAGWVDVDNPVTLEISGTTGHAVIMQDQLYYNCAKVPGADGKGPFKMLPPALPAPMHMFLDEVAGKTGGALVKPAEAAARVAGMEAMYNAHKTGNWAKPV